MVQDNLEAPSFFSIQDTTELGSGSAKLLEGLLTPETSTADPDKVEKIDTTQKTTTAKPAPVKKQEKKEDVEDKEKVKQKSLEDKLLEDENESEEEEEEETTTKAKKVQSEEEEKEDGNEDNRFKALSKDLLKLGVFSAEEGEEDIDITTPEDFLARFRAEKQKGAIQIVDEFLGQFGEEYVNAFNAIFANGVNPREYFNTFNKIENLAELDLTKEENQKAIIRQYFAEQDLESSEVDKEIERLTSFGELENVSQRYHKILVKKEAAQLEQLEKTSQERIQQQKAFKQNYQNNVRTILETKLKATNFDGIPLNVNLANEVRDFLVTEKYKTPSGETLTDFDVAILNLKKPENHEKKVKLGLLLKILEKDPTLSTIQKTGVTKKTEELFSEIKKSGTKGATKTTKSNNEPAIKSWFS